jgi:hypothetical protein
MYFLDAGQQTQEIIRLERQSWHHPAYQYLLIPILAQPPVVLVLVQWLVVVWDQQRC